MRAMFRCRDRGKSKRHVERRRTRVVRTQTEFFESTCGVTHESLHHRRADAAASRRCGYIQSTHAPDLLVSCERVDVQTAHATHLPVARCEIRSFAGFV